MEDRLSMLRCLAAADFALYDTRLFLDTHPDDSEALAAAEKYQQRASLLRSKYEKIYGPLTIEKAAQTGESWLSDPWPWDIICERRR